MKNAVLALVALFMAFINQSHAQGGGPDQIIKIKKDKYYQLARISVNPEKKAQFDDYFAKLGPTMMASGLKIVGRFSVVEALDGNGPAQMILIGEYPNAEAPKALFSSEEFLNLRNQRDASITYLNEGYFQATEDGEFNVGDSEVLEMASLWMKEDGQPKLNAYFQAVMPEATQLGLRIAPFRFISASEKGNYHPSVVVLGSWKTQKGRDQFFNGATFKAHVAKRTAALKFLEMYVIKSLPMGGQTQH